MSFFFLFLLSFGKKNQEHSGWEYSTTLQKVILKEGSKSLTIKVECRILAKFSGDFARYTFRDITLFVIETKLGFRNNSYLFEFQRSNYTTGLLSGLQPIYESGMMVTEPFPSARLVTSNSGIYLILFDGLKGYLYYKNDEMTRFVIRKDVSENEKKILANFYAKAFDPSDVYWDYFLVVHAPFFGHGLVQKIKRKVIDTDILYKMWKTNVMQGKR